jgi:lysophospholipase L1-like esterase
MRSAMKCIVPCIALFLTAGTLSAFSLTEDILSRAILSEGDPSRLQRVFRKAEQGGPIVIGVIGGSITQGSSISTPYPNVVLNWWKRTFPKAKCTLINAGIGATGSGYGTMRARRDLLSHKPDLVVMEYAVNDSPTKACAEAYEGLARQILNAPEKPALVLLFMMQKDGSNSQEWQVRIGKHYSLPLVSYRDALWPEIKEGRLRWEQISPDGVHPNDFGHLLAGEMLQGLFKRAFQTYSVVGKPGAGPDIPAPLISDRYEHATLHARADLRPVKNRGWRRNNADRTALDWQSSQPGSTMQFEFEGEDIYLYYWYERGPMGKVRARVDGTEPVIIDAWFDQTWGGYIASATIGENLKPGKHTVTVELLDDKNPRSSGNKFRIFEFGATGVKLVGRDPALWPFDADDPWNRPIGSNANYAPVKKGGYNSKSPNRAVVNCLHYSVPVYNAAKNDPIREIRTWYGDKGGQFGGEIRVPAKARPSVGTDAHMAIVSENHDSVVELGVVSLYGPGNLNSWLAFQNDLTGSGVYPHIHGVRAYGGSALGGLIRKGELTYGIPHALALATSQFNLNSKAPGGKTYVWPACSSDYEFPQSLWPPGKKPYQDWYGKTGNLHIGTLLAIPPEVNIATIGVGTSGPTYEIARALQDYGGYIVDMGEAPLAWYADYEAADELGGVEKLKAQGGGGAALEVAKLLPYLRVVTNNSPESIGGGGIPRRSPAPPFHPAFLESKKRKP